MDYSKAIEIAPDVFWVGYVIENDPFQCHVYLIKNGDESILIDPGSMITFPVVHEKITSVVPLKDIKYIIMHHQDPDITGCYSTLEKLFPQGERYIVTHWRSETLLKHNQWKTPFYLVDKNDWKLKAGERELEFVFTPYAHFPGAFCTYDKKSGVLFSSDLLSALTPEFQLFAKSADRYFEYAKLFHEHYIPCKTVLENALNHIEKKNPEMIAPQHGSIIKKEIINPLIRKLKNLECGLYMLDDEEDDLKILITAEEVCKHFINDVISNAKFDFVLKNLFFYTKQVLKSLQKIEICGKSTLSNEKLCFEYDEFKTNEKEKNFCLIKKSLYNEKNKNTGELNIYMGDKLTQEEEKFLNLLLKHIISPLTVSLEKEIMFIELKKRNKFFHKKAITDNLTELYNREFMQEYLNKKILEAKRYRFPLSIAIIDIDFFKKINDKYGHLIGDCVLKELGKMMKEFFRGSDVAIRYGGEEFVIILPFSKLKDACKRMEEFRKEIENYIFCRKKRIKITISSGVYEMNEKDNLKSLLENADKKLYIAKKSGRNKVIC